MPKILIVDDLATDRRLAGGLLEKDIDLTVEYATNGAEAIARIQEQPPELVVTDLVMPEMTGLELVTAIRRNHPHIPVILMTSAGSEEIAAEALQKGAASYVPKRLLSQYLLETVHRLLAVAGQQRNRLRLLGCMATSDCSFELETDPTLVSLLVGYLSESIEHIGLFDETARLQVSVALEEALVNALYHGNLEVGSELRETDEEAYRRLVQARLESPPYRNRTISIKARLTPEMAEFTIRDQGPGFDIHNLPDPTDPENLEKSYGRGVLLMQAFMDDVTYNSTGNEVTMRKRNTRDEL